MCVICYIPKNNFNIAEEDLRKMWNSNPHGAGIMWRDDKNDVYFSKGYMDFIDFYRDYLIIKNDYNYECAVHFRIATSGGVNAPMCHPFTLTNNINDIKQIKGKSKVCIMHNGIIDINSTRSDINDTCEYITRVLYPRYKVNHNFFRKAKQQKKMENEIGYSKLLFFSNKGVEMVGDWKEYKGCYCSNLYFDTPTYYYNYTTPKYYYDKTVWDSLDLDDDDAYIAKYYKKSRA